VIRTALARFAHVSMPPRAFELAAHLRAIHGLRTPDSLHMAAASLGGCDALWTNDGQLLSAMPEFAFNPYDAS
jgi:predicted nucleic acid-binding protein